MKTNTFLQGITIALIAAASAETKAPAMRDAATHEQLALALRKADQADPMKNMPAAKGADPSVVNQPKDLLSQSDIISFRGVATLVPKRAILQIPKTCADRMKFEPGSKIVGWAEFYAANRAWISTVEVSRVQAEGNKPLAEESQKFMTTCRNLVVATYQGGPISMLPLKVPVENEKEVPAQKGKAIPAETAKVAAAQTANSK